VSEQTQHFSLEQGYNLHWYEIQSVLGRGGNGMTYLAHDKNLDRLVAIKEYLPINCAAHDHQGTVQPLMESCANHYYMGLSRFLKEARILAKFVHPNIVRVHSVFECNNTAYMVMEYEQGQDLAEFYEGQKNISEQALLSMFIPILDGLLIVHQSGFIHRDIKPANIYVRQDHSPVLLDFGSAKQTSYELTRTLTILATYGYTPFEQYGRWNMQQGPWTDIYSLGASIYYGITGEKPIDSLNRAGAIIGSNRDVLVPLSEQALQGYSKHFLLAVDNALMFHPKDRPQDILQWVDMLLGKVMPPPLPENLITRSVDDLADIYADANISDAQEESDAIVGRHSIPDHISPGDLAPAVKDLPNQSNSIYSGGECFTGIADERNLDAVMQRLESTAKDQPSFGFMLKAPQLVLPAVLLLLLAVGVFISILLQENEITQPVVANKAQLPVDRELNELLEKARRAYSVKQYITPESDNAATLYSKALTIDPDNQAAKEGLESVVAQVSRQIIASIESGDFLQAETRLTKLDHVAIKYADLLQLQLTLEKAKRARAESINKLLNKAQIAFGAGHFVQPENDNAIRFFRQVLSIDPANNTAQRGLQQIHDHFLPKATQYVAAGDIDKAGAAVAVMESAIPDSSQAQFIRMNIQVLEDKNRQIAKLYRQAEADVNSGRMVTPSGNNALQRYKQILKLDKSNQKAKQGIKDLLAYYESQFHSNVADKKLSDAEKAVDAIALISPNSSLSKKLAAQLAGLRQPSKPKLTSSVQPSRPELETINELIHDFRNSFESSNLTKLQDLSEFAPGRQQFLAQFFDHYRFFKMEIRDFEYIIVQHQASAIVSLNDLVNKEGEYVKPGSWNRFLIQIAKNEQGKWKVHW
jgi:serine/threonine protein kinase